MSELLNTNIEQVDKKEIITDKYNELNEVRILCEEDASEVFKSYKELRLSYEMGQISEDEYLLKSEKIKKYFELDETTVSKVENNMLNLEYKLGVSTDKSVRFDNFENDVLVNSSFLYQDRINMIKEATGDENIDLAFVDSIIAYARAVEFDENDTKYFDDLKQKQAYLQNRQKTRSACHNNMIEQMNALNDIAIKNECKPLMYRNLVKNSVVNGYKNTEQMYHDRVSLARYVAGVIEFSGDKTKLPDSKYIKET